MLSMQRSEQIKSYHLLVYLMEPRQLERRPFTVNRKHIGLSNVLGKNLVGLLSNYATHLDVANATHLLPFLGVSVAFDLKVLQTLQKRIFVDCLDILFNATVGWIHLLDNLHRHKRSALIFLHAEKHLSIGGGIRVLEHCLPIP
jgi:hypothetical protein